MKICIVKLSAMGDIIHAMVALEYIKKSLPNAQIDWVVEEGFSSLLDHNPHITNILKVNLKSLKVKKSAVFKQIKLLRTFSKNNYDIIIDAQGLLKSAIVSKIIGAKVIAGYSKSSIREGIASYFYDKKITIPYHENTIDRNVRVLCEPLNITTTQESILTKKSFLYFGDVHTQTIAQPYNLFVIGSTWESRNYPKEKFVTIAERLEQRTYVVWGNKEEHTKALWMEEQSSYIIVLEKVSLNGLKKIIASAQLVIGNDTGPTHMAWALNIPSITIFGPTPINRVYITPINKVIKSKSDIDHYKLNKNDFSINEIDPDAIVKIAKDLI